MTAAACISPYLEQPVRDYADALEAALEKAEQRAARGEPGARIAVQTLRKELRRLEHRERNDG